MKKNVGELDQIVRVMVGTALVATGLIRRRWWNVATVTGAGLLYSAYSRYCPLSAALGVDTSDKPNHSNEQLVDESSEESMIASDPPAWTMGREPKA